VIILHLAFLCVLLSGTVYDVDVIKCLQDLAQLQEAAQCLTGFRESREIDPEAFSRLIFVARSVAAFRPTNLVLFAEKYFMSAVSGVLLCSVLYQSAT